MGYWVKRFRKVSEDDMSAVDSVEAQCPFVYHLQELGLARVAFTKAMLELAKLVSGGQELDKMVVHEPLQNFNHNTG